MFLLLFYANTAQSKIEENTVFSTEFLLIRIQESEINAELLDLDPHGIFDIFIKCAWTLFLFKRLLREMTFYKDFQISTFC